MGWYKAKCNNCWDSIPCNCPAQQGRETSINTATQQKLAEEHNRLLREQNELLRQLIQRRKP